MIQDFLLKRALSIRKEYLRITKDIETYENMVSNILKSLDTNSKSLEVIKEKIDSNKINDVELAKTELLKVIINLEEESNKTGMHVNNLNKKIDNLREQELLLYKDIKDKYPEMNDESIKKEIQDYIISK